MLSKGGYREFTKCLFGFVGISYSPWEDTLMLVADTIHSKSEVAHRYYTLFVDFDQVDVETTNRDGATKTESYSFDELQKKDWAFDSVLRSLDHVKEWPCHLFIHHSPAPQWDFIYDEEYPDADGANFSGVIARSDGGYRCLFFHAYCKDEDSTPICHVYDSIMNMTQHDNELCSYPWTAENDSILLNALNALNNSQDYCGDESSLRALEFKPGSDD